MVLIVGGDDGGAEGFGPQIVGDGELQASTVEIGSLHLCNNLHKHFRCSYTDEFVEEYLKRRRQHLCLFGQEQ